jgi:hypothetical protein
MPDLELEQIEIALLTVFCLSLAGVLATSRSPALGWVASPLLGFSFLLAFVILFRRLRGSRRILNEIRGPTPPESGA